MTEQDDKAGANLIGLILLLLILYYALGSWGEVWIFIKNMFNLFITLIKELATMMK